MPYSAGMQSYTVTARKDYIFYSCFIENIYRSSYKGENKSCSIFIFMLSVTAFCRSAIKVSQIKVLHFVLTLRKFLVLTRIYGCSENKILKDVKPGIVVRMT